MNTTWKETDKDETTFEGKDRRTNKVMWKATRADLIFGFKLTIKSIIRSICL